MSAPVYFISDLHLDSSRPAVTDALAAFLDARRDAAALYILGDLFEFWVGDDDDSAIATQVSELLAAYAQAGPRVYLMHGNRDFLIGQAFSERVGATLLDDPSVVEEFGTRLLLMHGDSLCTLDTDYQAFRQQARSPDWQRDILALPLGTRRELAAQLRTVSKDAGSRKSEDIMDVTDDEVLREMRSAAVDTLIHGHTHRPARHENSAGERWVLGDWEQQGWYLQLDTTGLKLISFNINQ